MCIVQSKGNLEILFNKKDKPCTFLTVVRKHITSLSNWPITYDVKIRVLGCGCAGACSAEMRLASKKEGIKQGNISSLPEFFFLHRVPDMSIN